MSQRRSSRLRKARCFLFGSWWVFVSIFFAFCGYRQATGWLDEEYAALLEKKESLLLYLQTQRDYHQELLAQIESLQDPEWIFLILKDELGLVLPGETKVYFEPGKDS